MCDSSGRSIGGSSSRTHMCLYPQRRRRNYRTVEGGGKKKSGATTPVYNHIMESKWPDTIRKRILFTGFTLCVVLGEC